MDIPLDVTDPIVVLLTWALTSVVGYFVNLVDKPKLRIALPMVAVLLATGSQAALAAFDGTLVIDDAFQWSVAMEGLAAGAMAVFGHSQMRELLKLVQPAQPPPAEPAPAPQPKAKAPTTTTLIALFAIAASAFGGGCMKQLVLRDATVYSNQVAWLEARNQESIAAFQRAMDTATAADDHEGCLVYAEQLLIGQHATAWRYAMMLHLADLGADPGDPAPIPAATTLCPEAEPEAVVSDIPAVTVEPSDTLEEE